LTQLDTIRRALLGAAALLLVLPAVAHHSAAMFDHDKSVTLKGAVKEFQWSNPHCWIQVLVAGNGGPEEWSVELGAPSTLYRNGWRPGTLKPGDRITVIVHPMRDGTRGGSLVSATGADGNPIGPSSSPK
jgi:hypothetical protein